MEDSIVNLHGQADLNIFSIFYQAAFLLPFMILIIIAIRRKYDMGSWFAIMLSGALFFLLGTRITTFTVNEWSVLFKTGSWPVSYHKFALGGTCFALLGIHLARKFLRFDRPVFAIYAWVSPIGLAIQKIGCLSAGCCYGSPTSLPWGIKYASGSIPYLDHLAGGLVERGDISSLPVHPAQLYQLLLYLLISVLVLTFRKKFRNPKSILTFALLLLAASRFLVEFAIDPDASVYGSGLFLGLKPLQWICLSGFFVILLFHIRYERIPARNPQSIILKPGITRPIIVLSAITIIFILLHGAFTGTELIAFNIRFLLLTAMMTVVVFTRITIPGLRIFSSFLMLLPILLLSQTVPKDKLDYEKNSMIMFGTSIARYYNEVLYDEGPGSCGGPSYQHLPYENNYLNLAGGYAETGSSGFRRYSYGGYFTAGYVKETNLLNSESLTRPFVSTSPFAEYNWRWLGIGGSLHLGYLLYTPMKPSSETSAPEKNHKFTPALPGFTARIGPYDIFDIKVMFASGFPSPLPDNLWDLSIGSGLGSKLGSGVRLGTAGLEPGSNFYLEGHFFIQNNLGIDFRYSYGDLSYIAERAGKTNEFRLGFRYTLDR